MVFQLENPDIALVVDYCNNMLPKDRLEVFDFGCNGDIYLEIVMNEEDDPYPEMSRYPYLQIYITIDGYDITEPEYVRLDNLSLSDILNQIWSKQGYEVRI